MRVVEEIPGDRDPIEALHEAFAPYFDVQPYEIYERELEKEKNEKAG